MLFLSFYDIISLMSTELSIPRPETYTVVGYGHRNMGFQRLFVHGSLITPPSELDAMNSHDKLGFPVLVGGHLRTHALNAPRLNSETKRRPASVVLQSGEHPNLGRIYGVSLCFATPEQRSMSADTITYVDADPDPSDYIRTEHAKGGANNQDVALAMFEEVLQIDRTRSDHPLYDMLYVSSLVELAPIQK